MKQTIVIIENDAQDRDLIQSMLSGPSGAEYHVICAGTGNEGLAAIGTGRPDCVLLDHDLPGQGSAATWSRIRARHPGLAMVMLTGDAVDFDSLEAMRAEGQEYIAKSEISPETLHAAVSNAILAARGGREQGGRPAAAFTVLVAGASQDERAGLIRSLKQSGEHLRCMEAADGPASLALMEHARPDCVLLDASLCAPGGQEVLRRMQAVDAFLPVIMLMEAGDDAIAAQAMQAGAHSVLVKTVLTPSLLHGAIASAIGHAALERQIDQQRTQIAKAKRALARSDRLNEAIVNSAAYMVVATDIGGKILLFNPESERQLGYRAEDIVGQITPMAWLDAEEVAARAAEMGLGEAYEADFSVISREAETEGVSRREWTCLRRNGESFTANFTVSALRDGQGPATGFLIVGEDITDAKRRQDTLRAREELFRGAMEHAPTGIALIDTGGRFLKVNAALCDMLGYAAGDLEGRHEHSVTDPEDIELDIEDARQLLAGKIAAYKVEKRLIRADGGVAYALQAMSLMRHEGGAPHYFVAQFQDIGDAKRAERHRSDFASLAGHQLRTPLTSIRGAVGLLAAVLGDALPPRGHQLLEIASRNCDRLVAVVNDLLTIDRMAQGEMRFEMRDEDAGALMLAAIEAHRPACQTLGVSVVMEPAPAGLMVHADGARLTQVMVNLLANAVRHSPEQGQIRVGAVRAESKLRLWVKDQGPGIAPEAAARIFDCPSADYEPARILDGPGQPGGKTSGLGLHVSRRIVEGMGGSIGVDSMPGVGSTFWVDWPGGVVVAAPMPAAPVRRADGSTAKRILICEDDDNLAALIQLMLSRAGYAADVVHSVPEARRRLASGSYGAMTLDLTLPLGDGLDFARELRAAAATHDFPVIIVSGSNRDERASVPGDAGIVDWIVKPFDKERLVRSVEKAASTHLRLAHSA